MVASTGNRLLGMWLSQIHNTTAWVVSKREKPLQLPFSLVCLGAFGAPGFLKGLPYGPSCLSLQINSLWVACSEAEGAESWISVADHLLCRIWERSSTYWVRIERAPGNIMALGFLVGHLRKGRRYFSSSQTRKPMDNVDFPLEKTNRSVEGLVWFGLVWL